MALKRMTVFVSGNVQVAGFRSFIKNLADSIDIKGYAENMPDGRVEIVCEGEEKGIEELINSIKNKVPSLSSVDDMQATYGEYAGEFLEFERRGRDVPKKATLDDLLNVMVSFDAKAEKMVSTLNKMLDKQDQMLDKQDTTIEVLKSVKEDTSTMLDKQDQMLDKQDTTIEVLKSVKEDTSQIKQDTSQIKQDTSSMPAIKEDAGEIKYSTREMISGLWNKYEELHREVSEIKATLSASHLV